MAAALLKDSTEYMYMLLHTVSYIHHADRLQETAQSAYEKTKETVSHGAQATKEAAQHTKVCLLA